MRGAAVDNFILVRGSDTSLVFYFIFFIIQYWVKCAVMVGAMLGDGWHNVGFWLAQCWVMIGATQACCWLMVGATLASGWHNVGVWLVQCWLIVVQRWLIIVGETLAYSWFCVGLWLAHSLVMVGTILDDGHGWHTVG